MKRKLSDIELHSVGAIVQANSIFDDLNTYQNETELSQDFREKWVLPFYHNLNHNDKEWINKIITIKNNITNEIILNNLGDFNWRTRSTGAFFAAIKNAKQFTDIIGIHLLKSEVCFAGAVYAKTLCSFNTELSIEYLIRYLNYYLTRIDLDFDQVEVMTAINYLDFINGTNIATTINDKWLTFIELKFKKAEASFENMKSKLNLNEEQLNAYYGHVKYWQSDLDITSYAMSIDTIEKIKNGS